MNDVCRRLPASINLLEVIPSPEATACLELESARRLGVLPVAISDEGDCVLVLACKQMADLTQRERIAQYLPIGYRLVFLDCDEQLLPEAIENCYRSRTHVQALFDWRYANACLPDIPVHDEHLAIEIIDWLILRASREGASDIHLSPTTDTIHCRLRIDGVLVRCASLTKALLSSLLVRIKIMGGLDIAESRHAQDGQFRRYIDAHPVDVRVSTFPTVDGENTVLRLIDSHRRLDSLQSLDLPDDMHRHLQAVTSSPEGMAVFCGPTGAGKSTTMFAMLNEIDTSVKSVMTLEDPVEHRVAGVCQTSIKTSQQWGYAQALRAVLRQDPDVLLIGEIRDSESCSIVLRAVSTGHQILTTVHASCAHSALHRLRELNAGDGALGLSLRVVVAQRLIRKLCHRCKRETNECPHCLGTGFKGRKVVMEILEINEQIRGLLVAQANIETIKKASADAGFVGMRQQAMTLVATGITSEAEVVRVFGKNSQGGQSD